MSVIVSRASPDVRDGLKPVHRRILYSMFDQGLRPDRPHAKCAKVVGEVMGTYHLHGDSAIADAAGAQWCRTFRCVTRPISGHGNFGRQPTRRGRGCDAVRASTRALSARTARLH